MNRPEEDRPLPLEYCTPRKSIYHHGATKSARIAAAICCLLFAGIALDCWFFAARGDRPLWEAGVVSAAGSIFLLLVAVGVIGKHKSEDT